jgi:hypothetical protein
MFRKEEVGDLLSLRYDDTPETLGNEKTSAPQDTYINADVDMRQPKGTMQVCLCVCGGGAWGLVCAL